MIWHLHSLVIIQMHWNLSPHRSLHVKVYSSFICNCQSLKTARCLSAGEWIKHVVAFEETLLRAKNEWACKSWKDMEENETHITRWEKSGWKGYILYNSNYTTSWNRQNYRTSEMISGCQRLGERRGEQAERRGFFGQGIYSAWDYKGEYMSFNISKHIRVHYQEWTLMQTTDFGRQRCFQSQFRRKEWSSVLWLCLHWGLLKAWGAGSIWGL